MSKSSEFNDPVNPAQTPTKTPQITPNLEINPNDKLGSACISQIGNVGGSNSAETLKNFKNTFFFSLWSCDGMEC